jgi:hypothetical protein
MGGAADASIVAKSKAVKMTAGGLFLTYGNNPFFTVGILIFNDKKFPESFDGIIAILAKRAIFYWGFVEPHKCMVFRFEAIP